MKAHELSEKGEVALRKADSMKIAFEAIEAVHKCK